MCYMANAQAPEALNYSAIVRNGSGTPIPNQAVAFRLSILKGGLTGFSVYTETHQVTTDANGMVNLEIGRGSIVSGSFKGIAWNNDSYYLKVEVDASGGTNYTDVGTTQLLSVPYALYAKYAETTLASTGSSLDTVQPFSFFDNHFTSLTQLNITDYINGYVLEKMQADKSGNIISWLSYGSKIYSHKYSGALNFTVTPPLGNFDNFFLDHLGNIYTLLSIEQIFSTTSINFGNSVSLQYNESTSNCSAGLRILAKYNSSGIVQWAKWLPVNGCSRGGGDMYPDINYDVDSAGNIYIQHYKWIIKYNTNGDSVSTTIHNDTTDYGIDVNNNGEFVMGGRTNNVGVTKIFNANNTLKWTFFNSSFSGSSLSQYFDDSGKYYLAGCNENYFSINENTYYERSDSKPTFKLIGISNPGRMDSYFRYVNSPSNETCLYTKAKLFKLDGKISMISGFSSIFYNNGVRYNPGLYLVKF